MSYTPIPNSAKLGYDEVADMFATQAVKNMQKTFDKFKQYIHDNKIPFWVSISL